MISHARPSRQTITGGLFINLPTITRCPSHLIIPILQKFIHLGWWLFALLFQLGFAVLNPPTPMLRVSIFAVTSTTQLHISGLQITDEQPAGCSWCCLLPLTIIRFNGSVGLKLKNHSTTTFALSKVSSVNSGWEST